MSRRRIINGKTIFSAVIVVLLIVVTVVLVKMGNRGYSDEYFVTDNTKIVLSSGYDSAYEDTAYRPPIMHRVYYYSGEKITGIKIFFEYMNEGIAKKAYEHITLDKKEWAEDKTLSGKYIIFNMKKELYETMTTERARQIVDGANPDAFDREKALLDGYKGEDIIEEPETTDEESESSDTE